MGTPIKEIKKYTSLNLNEDYKEELTTLLPILNYNNLLDFVVEYCNEVMSYDKPDKESYIRYGILKDMSKILKELKKNIINFNNKYETKYTKEIKEINVYGLIQAIILCTINYYDKDISPSFYRLNIKNNSSYLITNRVNGVTLAKYVLDLYQNNILSDMEKDKIFIDILKIISIKLENLQDKAGFIHGDFHADNIIIDTNQNIKFIDFEFSVIKLPAKSWDNILLCATESVNLRRKDILDLKNDPKLKAIDLFHLIVYFDRLNKNEYNNLLDNILNKINKYCFDDKWIYYNKNKNKYNNLQEYTSSFNFIKESNNLEKLYPENFKKIEFDMNTNTLKRDSDYNSNNNKLIKKLKLNNNVNNVNNLNYNSYFDRFK